jgi:transcriptional regulator with XRE-family HTH domain
MADPAWFAARLREMRESAGLTQEQLADRAGVKRDAVARWEAGKREPGWSSVLALCQALGVSCEAFTKEPAPREGAAPGRPPKRAEGAPAADKPKRPQGRPPKQADADQTSPRQPPRSDRGQPSGQKGPTRKTE